MHSDDRRERTPAKNARSGAAPVRAVVGPGEPDRRPTSGPSEASHVRRLVTSLTTLAEDDPERFLRFSELLALRPQDVFEVAVELSHEGRQQQCLAADILAELRPLGGAGALRDATEPVLLRLAASAHPEVAAAALHAIGQRALPNALPALILASRHPDAGVRLAAATHLGAFSDANSHRALALLLSDPEREVRTWAAMGLAVPCDDESPAIAEALASRTDDPDDEVRIGVLAALAARHDPRGREPIARELRAGTVDATLFEAVAAYADRRFLEPLLRLRRLDRSHRSWVDEALDEAIAACRR